ncbi:MAG: hypothetical protein ACD_75C02597G0002 [uncultured bacterium]|nr:MAG: hypothetical protein ACD_75C02597G0002 [uncultured bacterium]
MADGSWKFGIICPEKAVCVGDEGKIYLMVFLFEVGQVNTDGCFILVFHTVYQKNPGGIRLKDFNGCFFILLEHHCPHAGHNSVRS